MSLITRIADLAIAIATDIKGINTTVSGFEARVTDNTDRIQLLEDTPASGDIDTAALKPAILKIIRDELEFYNVMRSEYAGTGWYKDVNGRVYCKDVPSFETRQFKDDPNIYVSLHDKDLDDSSGLIALMDDLGDKAVYATSNLTKLSIPSYENGVQTKTSALIFARSDDVSSWDVGHISNFDFAFKTAFELKGFDKLDLTNITSAESMFEGANRNVDIDFSGLDMSKVVNTKAMFKGYQPYIQYGGSISTVDFSGFDMSKVTDASFMFDGAWIKPTGLNGWKTAAITDMTNMLNVYGGMSGVADVDLTNWCVTNITVEPANFVTGLAENKKPVWGTCPYQGTGWYKNPVTGVVECNGVARGETHVFAGDPKTYVCVYSRGEINPSNMDVVATSNITYLGEVLYGASAADKDISHWDVSNVTNMTLAFGESDFAGDLSSWKVPLIATKPYGFLEGTPIENDLTKHPQWGVSP